MKSLLLLLVIAVTSAGAAPQSLPAKHPFFEMDAQTKRALVENAKSLKVGDTSKPVIARLGTPTFDQPLIRKEGNSVVGRSLSYYAVIWESGTVRSIHDQYVDVYLDEKDHVKTISIKVSPEN